LFINIIENQFFIYESIVCHIQKNKFKTFAKLQVTLQNAPE
jgi:hypothetical protein